MIGKKIFLTGCCVLVGGIFLLARSGYSQQETNAAQRPEDNRPQEWDEQKQELLRSIESLRGQLNRIDEKLMLVESRQKTSEQTISAVFGRGIVSGLDVIAVPGNEYVVVKPGSAINPHGISCELAAEEVLRVDRASSPDRNLYVIIDSVNGECEAKIWRGEKPPTDTVVLAQLVQAGTDPMTVSVECRSRSVQQPLTGK